MDKERPQSWAEKVAGAVEDIDFATALGELRRQMDCLIGRLAESPAGASAEREDRPATEAAAGDARIEDEMRSLARRVDAAADLVSGVTDLLEVQTDRIETIEAALGEAGLDLDLQPADGVDEVSVQALENRLGRVEGLLKSLPTVESRTPAPVEKADPVETPAAAGDEAVDDSSGANSRIEQLVASEAQRASGLRPAKRHPTVLVVDDAADARTILSLYLSKTGYQVVTAASAEDCLAKLLHHHVDVVVLDANLSGADGGHVCKVLRSEPGYAEQKDLPVIVYTAYPEQYARETASRWGADDYVVKGGDMLPLVTALVRHTGGAS